MFGGRMGEGAGGRGDQTSQKKIYCILYIYILYYMYFILYIIYYVYTIYYIYCLIYIVYVLFVSCTVLAWFCVSLLKQLLIGFVYFYCFSMVVRGFAEATTARICNFYCFSKIRKL